MPTFEEQCREAARDPSAALALREACLRRAVVVALALPGLAHRLQGSALVGPVALTALLDAAREAGLDAHRVGPLVWAAGREGLVEPLLDTLRAQVPGHLHPAAAVAAGEVLLGPEGDHHGVPVEQARALVRFARVGEVLLTPDAVERLSPPEGVGVFPAPRALTEAAGVAATVWRDYR